MLNLIVNFNLVYGVCSFNNIVTVRLRKWRLYSVCFRS